MILGINHVGIVVKSVNETVAVLSAAFGAEELSRKSFPELGQTSCMVKLGGSLLELMEPCGETGVVPRFLAEHGQGLHHISLLSDDLEGDYARCQAGEIRVLGDLNDPLRVVFTHPKSTNGVIYEITDIPFEAQDTAG